MFDNSCRRCSNVARWKSCRLVVFSCQEHLCATRGERVPELETDDCRRQWRKTHSSPHRCLHLLPKIQRRSEGARRGQKAIQLLQEMVSFEILAFRHFPCSFADTTLNLLITLTMWAAWALILLIAFLTAPRSVKWKNGQLIVWSAASSSWTPIPLNSAPLLLLLLAPLSRSRFNSNSTRSKSGTKGRTQSSETKELESCTASDTSILLSILVRLVDRMRQLGLVEELPGLHERSGSRKAKMKSTKSVPLVSALSKRETWTTSVPSSSLSGLWRLWSDNHTQDQKLSLNSPVIGMSRLKRLGIGSVRFRKMTSMLGVVTDTEDLSLKERWCQGTWRSSWGWWRLTLWTIPKGILLQQLDWLWRGKT